MDVFTSFLTVCGYAHKYIELGRFKKWITNLVSGEDSDLSGARKIEVPKQRRIGAANGETRMTNDEKKKASSADSSFVSR